MFMFLRSRFGSVCPLHYFQSFTNASQLPLSILLQRQTPIGGPAAIVSCPCHSCRSLCFNLKPNACSLQDAVTTARKRLLTAEAVEATLTAFFKMVSLFVNDRSDSYT